VAAVKTGLLRDFALDEAYTAEQARLKSPGRFWCARGADGGLRVIEADPVVWVSGQLLHLLHAGASHPDVTLDCWIEHPGRHGHGYTGDVIRINADGQRYVYVVGPCADEENLVWEARWPD
jgi:hypothetical protein